MQKRVNGFQGDVIRIDGVCHYFAGFVEEPAEVDASAVLPAPFDDCLNCDLGIASVTLDAGDTFDFGTTPDLAEVKFVFTGAPGTTATVIVNGTSFLVANVAGQFVWDSDNANGEQHTFTTIGEFIFSTASGEFFAVTWNGTGSLLFTVNLNPDVGSIPADVSSAVPAGPKVCPDPLDGNTVAGPTILLTVTGSASVTWGGASWTMPAESGVQKEVCPYIYNDPGGVPTAYAYLSAYRHTAEFGPAGSKIRLQHYFAGYSLSYALFAYRSVELASNGYNYLDKCYTYGCYTQAMAAMNSFGIPGLKIGDTQFGSFTASFNGNTYSWARGSGATPWPT